MVPKTAMELVQAAKAAIENLSAAQVATELSNGATLIDIREPAEQIESGKIKGSVLAPRGMLEFYADENLPYHKPEFNKAKRIILHCASGGRSALATQTLLAMGYTNVAHLDGGIKAWKDAGFDVE